MKYALITAARNEAAYIENTLHSVVSQTTLPCRWTIVNDGSTDKTEAIVHSYSKHFPWIKLLNAYPRPNRSFGAKAACVAMAYSEMQPLDFTFIGNIDADISFETDYFSYLLQKMLDNPRLGVVGTPFTESGFDSQKDTFSDSSHVHGACQLFRRPCFDQIGGYQPIEGGGRIGWPLSLPN